MSDELVMLRPPSLVRLILLHDDDTPKYLLINMLTEYFGLDHQTAQLVFYDLNNEGRVCLGVYTEDVSVMKSQQVYKALQGYPVRVTGEFIEERQSR